jgi:prepilin-type N-terminal cleavage/methylation domain-containing protein
LNCFPVALTCRGGKIMKLQKGFTLVELLVVITVIGILVALAVPNMQRIRTKAKEAKVMNGIHVIQTSLETFASNHDGLYPGVAVPAADDIDGIDPFETDTPQWFTLRALIGGGVVKPQSTQLDFLDGFYFVPNPAVPPFQVPDRLAADKSIDIYPENPFRTNITNVTDQAIPMLNMFGIEFTFVPAMASDIFIGDPSPVRICEPMWYGADGDATTITPAGQYDFPIPGAIGSRDLRFRGDINFPLTYDENMDWKITSGEIQQSMFPEGNFAYIPLDPVQTDPSTTDFMRFCRNYWLIAYGSTDSALRNQYKDVNPDFPRPLGDGDPTTLSAYEYVVKQALVGAMSVIATKYEDQVRVEGS